jgi:hydroxymethylbilane synthase
MRKIRIGTRGSQLALWQANFVQKSLAELNPHIAFEQIIIKTEGDRDQKSSLTQIGGQGVFTKTLEDALLDDAIDIAVHSLKDLPSKMTDGLMLSAVPARGPVEDVLVSENGESLDEMKIGAKVATGSIRRRSQLLNLRPDLQLSDLRGNIDTRLRKLKELDLDAIFMAKAAIVRLELHSTKYHTFDPNELVPAVGQGAVGVQVRDNDMNVLEAVHPFNHKATFQAVTAERMVLSTLDSGCQFPIGAYATVDDNLLKIQGFVGSEDGKTVLRAKNEGPADDAEAVGKALAEDLIKQGALSLLNN